MSNGDLDWSFGDFPSMFVRRRFQLGLNQKQVAERLGANQGMVSKWERAIDPPSPKYRPAIAEFLGVSESDLDAMIALPPSELTKVGQELHRLIDDLIQAVRRQGD